MEALHMAVRALVVPERWRNVVAVSGEYLVT